MKINVKATAVALVAPVLLAAPVAAATSSSLVSGDFYMARNVTKNGSLTNSVSADKCETVQFRVRIHNTGPESATNVNVKATLPSGVSTSHSSEATVASTSSNPGSVTDTAGVKLSSAQKLSYVPGSAKLQDANQNNVGDLSDALFTTGVNVGSVGVSTQQRKFIVFQAKVDCPTTPVEQPKTPEQPAAPTTLPETGPEAGLAAAAGTGALGYAVHMYRRSRKAVADAFKSVK